MNFLQQIRQFVNSKREYPLLGAAVIGYYMLVFYYSANFDLANSWQQLIFLAGYFIGIPLSVIGSAYFILKRTKWSRFSPHVVFVLMCTFLTFYLLQHLHLPVPYKKVTVLIFILAAALSVKFNNYKILILLLAFMSVMPTISVSGNLYDKFTKTSTWNHQPDAILESRFVARPNVYYIQTDGYVNESTLKNSIYNFDNSNFDKWLTNEGFTRYENFRSNYSSTLKSNASMLNMKHHFLNDYSRFKNSRDYIMDDNAVVDIFGKNSYKTFFISEKPYLIMNRPNIKFDFCNFSTSEIPFIKDGWSVTKEIAPSIKRQISANKSSSNFFFIEKFDPGHIANSASYSTGIEGERQLYLERLQKANLWLRDLIDFINQNDPDAIVIIGADHGGFVGFETSKDSFAPITDPELLQSVFGAKLAIRWGKYYNAEVGSQLKSSVNLFRILFSILSDRPEFLEHLQSDASYNSLEPDGSQSVYKAIDD